MKKGLVAGVSLVVGLLTGATMMKKVSDKIVGKMNKDNNIYKGYYNVISQWLDLKNHDRGIEYWFKKKGYHSIAIYGMGNLGKCLYEELKKTDIEIKYAIDRNGMSEEGLPIFTLENELEKVDAVVVTAIYAFDEIEKNLKSKVNFDIVNLEDAIYES